MKIYAIIFGVSLSLGAILGAYVESKFVKAREAEILKQQIAEEIKRIPSAKAVADLVASSPVRIITQTREIKKYVSHSQKAADCDAVLTASGVQRVNEAIDKAKD